METRSKFLIGAVLALLVALPLMSTVLATSTYNAATDSDDAPKACPPQSQRLKEEYLGQLIKEGYLGHDDNGLHLGIVKDFLKEARNVTIEGNVTTHYRNILVLQTSTSRLNILLPPIWSVNAEDKVLNLTEVFNNYVKSGDTVKITALERDFKNEKGVTISIIVAYEIMDTTSNNHLYAILPFNISP